MIEVASVPFGNTTTLDRSLADHAGPSRGP